MDVFLYLKSLAGLAFVLGLLFLFYRGMQYVKNKGYVPALLSKESSSFRQAESFSVDGKRKIVIITQGERRYTLLLGVTDLLLAVDDAAAERTTQ